MSDRVVALVDMDCFYCQVETRLNPSLKGKPMAVVQYNQWKGGGIIAVNYEARDKGVTRHMRGDEAKKHCPEIQLVSVPAVRGKADLTKYRDAGREVIKVICEFSECVQRASVDEAYIDLTEAVVKRLSQEVKVSLAQLENSFVVGYSPENSNDNDERERGVSTWLQEVYSTELQDPTLHKLATAAALVEDMRAAVFEKTGFRCSAGISHNKILAKLVCGLHKPNRQTVLPMASVAELYGSLPVQKVRNLGGKFGADVVETLGISYMGELANFTEKQLQAKYDEKTGSWLFNIARGIDLDPVTPRLISKSIGCCKKFPGKTSLRSKQTVTHWLSELSAEVAERLDEDIHMNKRRAQLLTIHFSLGIDKRDVAMSRSVALPGYEAERIAACAFDILSKYNSATPSDNTWNPPIKYMGLSVGKFMDVSKNSSGIDKFFKQLAPSEKIIDISSSSDPKPVSDNGVEDSSETNIKDQISKIDSEINNHASTSSGNSVVKKTNGQVSFFEKYFKNQPNKILKNSPKKPDLDGDRKVKSNSLQVNSDGFESKKNINDAMDLETSPYDTRKELQETKETMENNEEETWISPSEIFPDLEDIDDSVMNILPSPLQRKISNLKNSKNKSPVECNAQEKDYARDSRLSSDSNCSPTRVETVVEIHNFRERQSPAGTSSRCPLQRPASEEEDVVESLFDQSSPDIFELDSNEKDEAESEVRDECTYCKELILVSELPEHLDHHVAMELHDQLNKQPQQQPKRTSVSEQSRTNKTVTVLSDRKKRGRPSKKDNLAVKKSKSIMSFFAKS